MSDPSAYRVVRMFGEQGKREDQFVGPFGIALGPDSSLYIADDGAHAIRIYTREGKYLRSMGRKGGGPRELAFVDAIDFDSEGLCYIADTGNGRIQVWDAEGEPQRVLWKTITPRLQNPRDVVVGPHDNVWIADFSADRVVYCDKHGNAPKSFEGEGFGKLHGPIQMAFSPNNVLYVVEMHNHRVQFFAPFGESVGNRGGRGNALGQFQSPHGIAFLRDGRWVVVDHGNHRLQLFDENDEPLVVLGRKGSGPGELDLPTDVCIDEADRLYIVDKGNHRVQVWELKE